MNLSFENCPTCGKSNKVLTSHTDKNPNRQFIKCACGRFSWVDSLHAIKPVSVVPFSFSSEASEKEKNQWGENGTTGAGDSLDFLSVSPVAAEPVKKEFVPSKYQSAIFDFVKQDDGNAVVEAVAGSGKTTTLVQALGYTDSKADVAFVAFNKHIAEELKERAPEHVHVSTLHSLGYENVRKVLGGDIKLNEHKLWDLYTVTDPFGNNDELKPTVIKLVNLCKSTMKEPTKDNLDYLIDHYNVEVNGDAEKVYELVPQLYDKSIKVKEELDFSDMVYWNATGEVPAHKFDVLFIDELQDFSEMQLRMALNSVKPNGRIVGVGDTRQSIYGFSGAGIDSMQQAKSRFGGKELPLSICYRCPKEVVKLAQSIVPQIEWKPDARDGIVKDIKVLHDMRAGDMVLCRLNAPLVAPCFDLIRKGVKATIRGRDIGNGLVSMLERGKKKAMTDNANFVLAYLSNYIRMESAKLKQQRKDARAAQLEDQLETLYVLSEDCNSVGDIRRKIQQVFSDEKATVTFSSVHKAKGLEADRVFILKPELMPFKKATQAWELEQEMNLLYVSLSRAKQELYFVGERPSLLK